MTTKQLTPGDDKAPVMDRDGAPAFCLVFPALPEGLWAILLRSRVDIFVRSCAVSVIRAEASNPLTSRCRCLFKQGAPHSRCSRPSGPADAEKGWKLENWRRPTKHSIDSRKAKRGRANLEQLPIDVFASVTGLRKKWGMRPLSTRLQLFTCWPCILWCLWQASRQSSALDAAEGVSCRGVGAGSGLFFGL